MTDRTIINYQSITKQKFLFEHILHYCSKLLKLWDLAQLLTLTLVIEAIKVLKDSGASLICKDQTATVLIENFVDFLYRMKDRLPYSTIGFLKFT